MKRIFSITLTLMLALTMSAQKDVTSFMGVPVDGNRVTVISQLKNNGCKFANNTLVATFNGSEYNVDVLSSRKGVYQVRLTDVKGMESIDEALGRYNSMIEWFRDQNNYTEYEVNSLIYRGSDATHQKYIDEKWYYAEFFQKAVGHEEHYDKVVSFYLTSEYGGYRLVICFENRQNMVEK